VNMPGFTAETSLYSRGPHYRVAPFASRTVTLRLLTPAFPWLRCLGGCLGCIGGDEIECVFCRNCAICLLNPERCPDQWGKL